MFFLLNVYVQCCVIRFTDTVSVAAGIMILGIFFRRIDQRPTICVRSIYFENDDLNFMIVDSNRLEKMVLQFCKRESRI